MPEERNWKMNFEQLPKKIHFMGIGGISMSSLAAITKTKGHEVTGSDCTATPLTEKLTHTYGIPVYVPQRAENIGDAQMVVYTAAISEENPEFLCAKQKGLPLVPRSVYLGELMRQYDVRIGVSGTHGKSSTTGMLSHVFMQARLDPTVVCGALIPSFEGAYRLGEGEHFIYEACEYKDSFLDFYPSIALWLNMELDHVDYFKSMEQMEQSYIRSAKDAGAVVVNWDDAQIRHAAQGLKGVWTVKVGVERSDVDYSAQNVKVTGGLASFDLYNESNFLCRVSLNVPGMHHISNALCAAACAHICGVSAEDIGAGLESFGGIGRRFEYKGNKNGVRVYDDYAHHPTEIRVTLQAAREMLDEGGRLFCVFQPHTYSRTAGFFEEFVSALSLADELILAPIYAAREQNTYGVCSEDLAQKIDGARVIDDFDAIGALLAREVREKDLVLTMGAGNAFKSGEAFLKLP